MTPEELKKPPTEVEIAELMSALTPKGANILRRLVFQRDCLLEKDKRQDEVFKDWRKSIQQ